MALTAARSTATAQTVGTTWDTAFDAGAANSTPGQTVEVEADAANSTDVICRVNGGNEFRLTAGQVKYRRNTSIQKVEFKSASGTPSVLWDVDAAQP